MLVIRELMVDERSVMAADGAVVAAVLLTVLVLGGIGFTESAADLHERAGRGVMRVDTGAVPLHPV